MPVTVRVPATSANLGPGFDCLGLALDLWNEVTLVLEGEGYSVKNTGQGADFLPADQRSLVIKAFLQTYQQARTQPPPGLRVEAKNEIPVGSGLGSSAAAILAGCLGANSLLGGPFDPARLLEMANTLEGHPDNLAAALHGGLTAVTSAGDGLVTRCFEVPPLKVVLVIPDFRLSTRAARSALKTQVPLPDAVFNIGRTVFVVEALRTGDLSLLSQVMDDRLHQNQRFGIVPGAEAAVRAGRQAGAAAVALSGAGPALIAFAKSSHGEISEAMQGAFREAGLKSRSLILDTSAAGACLVPQGK